MGALRLTLFGDPWGGGLDVAFGPDKGDTPNSGPWRYVSTVGRIGGMNPVGSGVPVEDLVSFTFVALVVQG